MPDRVRVDTARALRGLKDFQRDTVEYVFRRMYLDAPAARRFLVADEVGLGKTLVAKGIIAKAIDYLWTENPDRRIDVVYVCSNLAIARQNIERLNLTGTTERSLPDRITLLPRTVRALREQKLNFIAFTPGTSFKMGSSHGRADERALLYWLLPDDWRAVEKGAKAVLRGGADPERFEAKVDALAHSPLEAEIRERFHAELAAPGARHAAEGLDLRTRFVRLAGRIGRRRALEDEERRESAGIVGSLRMMLATACIHALEPDLVILDEFQRFRDLLNGSDSASELADRLFTWEDVRVLLLSATPYKMYTLACDADQEDHFTDFLKTVEFLQNDPEATRTFRRQLDAFREQVFRYRPDDAAAARDARDAVQRTLRRVMVRTERLAVTPDRSGMLRHVVPALDLAPEDLEGFLALQRVARVVGHGDTTEYWKSAPYLLNFMDDYQLKTLFEEAAATSRSLELYDALADHAPVLLTRADLEAYRRLDPANARLRVLLGDTVDSGLWQLFWLPPSMPYYALAGPFGEHLSGSATKRLVFSAWQVVPKVVAALLSYEVERRMFGIDTDGRPAANTAMERDRRARLLQFALRDGRPERMNLMTLVYPSITLAAAVDPWRVARELAGGAKGPALPSLEDVRKTVRARLQSLIDTLPWAEAGGADVDARWYWAAPLLLDLREHERDLRDWLGRPGLAAEWRRNPEPSEDASLDAPEPDVDTAWGAHVRELRQVLRAETLGLGRRPDDLADVLALQALGSPAVVALRALCRVTEGLGAARHPYLRSLAGQVAHGFLSLFNLPEVTEAVRRRRGVRDEAYWRSVLEYAAEGCLQAVLDEYAHVLVDWHGVTGKDARTIATRVAETMVAALTVRAAVVTADLIAVDDRARRVVAGREHSDVFRFRTRFAARYGTQGQEERRAVERQVELQTAFNSPFWPFVLCTTSVGQEGLDFHLHCHAVVHWNLPSNPVDLEQREGRIHRFKGHAVRRNVARACSHLVVPADGDVDPWAAVFRAARERRSDTASDLVPYWVYLTEGGARIERHVPVLPLSRDSARADKLRKSLAVYRMAFGQSRQEDLVAFLLDRIGSDDLERASSDIRLDLSPDQSEARSESGEELRPEPTRVARSHHVDALAPWASGGLNVDSLGLVLDRFRHLQSGRAVASATAATGAVRPDLNQLRDLLDGFRRVTWRPTLGATHEDVRLARYRTLLDAFSALKRSENARIDTYRVLLDRFARTGGR